MPAFHVETATHIKAPRARVHEALVDFNTWPIWSPWLYLERDASITYKGERGEPGHGYDWSGDKIGAGGMVLGSSTEQHIACKLQFLKPFKSKAEVTFELAEVDKNNTQVTWLMDSSLPIFMFWMTNTMIAMIRSDYDRGLTMLKDYIELGTVPSRCTVGEIVDVEAENYIGNQVNTNVSNIGDSMSSSFGEVLQAIQANSSSVSGVPFTLYDHMDMKRDQCTYTAAIPVAEVVKATAPLVSGKRNSCRALKVVHTGPYRHLGNSWSFMISEMKHQKLKANKKQPPFERYVNDPETTAEQDLITEIYTPLRG